MQPHTCSELQAADQLYLVSLSLSEPKECVCMWTSVCGNKNTPCCHCCYRAFLTLGSFLGDWNHLWIYPVDWLYIFFEDILFLIFELLLWQVSVFRYGLILDRIPSPQKPPNAHRSYMHLSRRRIKHLYSLTTLRASVKTFKWAFVCHVGLDLSVKADLRLQIALYFDCKQILWDLMGMQSRSQLQQRRNPISECESAPFSI